MGRESEIWGFFSLGAERVDLWGSLWITLKNVKNGIFVYVLFL